METAKRLKYLGFLRLANITTIPRSTTRLLRLILRLNQELLWGWSCFSRPAEVMLSWRFRYRFRRWIWSDEFEK
jgi:hypothetical protein